MDFPVFFGKFISNFGTIEALGKQKFINNLQEKDRRSKFSRLHNLVRIIPGKNSHKQMPQTKYLGGFILSRVLGMLTFYFANT